MARNDNRLPDPYDNGFSDNYDAAMRKRIRGWRDDNLSFYSISTLKLPEFKVSGYKIQKETNIHDLDILEGAEGIQQGILFMEGRGYSPDQIWRKVLDEGVYVDRTSISFALKEWNKDNNSMPQRRSQSRWSANRKRPVYEGFVRNLVEGSKPFHFGHRPKF